MAGGSERMVEKAGEWFRHGYGSIRQIAFYILFTGQEYKLLFWLLITFEIQSNSLFMTS